MEVRSKFRQTDAGLIPDDWDAKPLRDTCLAIYRGASPRPIGDPRWFDEGSCIGWVRISDVTNSKRYLRDTTQRLSKEGIERSRFVPSGSLIMSICATVGRPIETAVDTCIHDGFVVFENPTVDQGLLYHVLCDLEPRWSTKGQTGSQMNLNTDLIKITPIPIPGTKREQTAIATALNDADALLSGLDRLIAKKRDLKLAAMQQLLTGKTRLPGFDEEWTFTSLGKHVKFLNHATNSRAELHADGAVKYLHYGDIHASSHTILEPIGLPSIPEHKVRRIDRLCDGDLVFSDASEDLSGVCKSVEIRDVADVELVAGLHTIAARFDKNILADGFKAYLQFCPVFANQIRRLAAGTKVLATNRSHIASVEMHLPGTGEQAAIASVLQDMDAEIEALGQRRAKTADLKQAMMQELLTGRTRLVTPETTKAQRTIAPKDTKGPSWAFKEAVVIAVLTRHFGSETYPLGRKRYTKFAYLMHRCLEGKAEGYLKKAAGPYNPKTKYAGPEKIAKHSGYIKEHKGPKGHTGFIVADNISQAEGYFEKWHGNEVFGWLEQFRFAKNDDLGALTTVDKAVVELRSAGLSVNVEAVKGLMREDPEWKKKLKLPEYNDSNIAKLIQQSEALFGTAVPGGSHG